jgi:predicted NBD/HSP70 family sugar kinase
VPVYVLNDSQAAAMGEFTYGRDHQADDHLIVINIGHGIGSGIIINGRLFQGDGGGAGEIGHVVVVPEGGLLCRCGKYGCLETVASARAVLQRIQLASARTNGSSAPGYPAEIGLESVERAFRGEDALVQEAVLDAGRYLGLAISGLIGTLNIRKIVLTGDMTRFGSAWLRTIRETVSQYSLAGLAGETQVEIGQLAEDPVILGASALLANNYALLLRQESAEVMEDAR